MSLSPGTKLGPYEILSPLGAGGMGEVYRARDTRLGRDVAVKVLPQHLSSNSEVRARFEREAKTVSSLNHPHICTLFDVGREGDTDYLVMELIEGETLAARLAKGPLPVADTLRIGSQIADALDRAHRAGVVHRDLKPGNIMLTRGGAKLMDFGLARATGLAGAPGSGSIASLTHSPTMAQPLTAEGTIVGTFQYMSPEQLEGKESDARSDLWAFGCVLYEMATGKRAFEGKSQASLIGAIMHAEPAPISQIAPMTPPELDRLVRAMLVKDPHDRLQSAHDVKLQLAWLADGARSGSGMAAAVPHSVAAPSRGRRWPAIAIAAIVGAALTGLVMKLAQQDAGPEHARSLLPQRYVLGNAQLGLGSTPAPAPDGSYVVYSVREGGKASIHRRDRTSLDAVLVAGTEEGIAPFVSPDGAWIGFCTPTAIKKVPATGGVAQTIAAVPRVESADWGNNDMIYYCPRSGGDDHIALARVPAAGGLPETVARLDSTTREAEAWLPDIMPDGETVLITISGGRASWHVCAIKPDGTRQEIVDNALLARYRAPGHLLYVDLNSAAVLCAPFEAKEMRITGAAIPLTEPLDLQQAYGVDDHGMLVYVPPADAGAGKELVWINPDGVVSIASETRSSWAQPRVSPDGRRVLVRKSMLNCELWVYDTTRGTLGRVVAATTDNHDAIWSPDGRSIAYLQANAGGHMVVQSVEGARQVKVIETGDAQGHPQSWSAGGNRLVYTAAGHGTMTDIWTLVMDGVSKPEPFVKSQFDEVTPSISTDGRFIAYTTNESGANEVVVRQCPDSGQSWQVSVGGGQSPLWSRDGRVLYFVSGSRMMSATVNTRDGFDSGTPQEAFEGGFDHDRPRYFDIAPDGRRFVAVRTPGGVAGQRQLRVLLNWPAEAKRLEGSSR